VRDQLLAFDVADLAKPAEECREFGHPLLRSPLGA
jgi:hypothetical protein